MEFKLIIKKINNTLSEEEEINFQDWFDKSEINRNYFYKVQENYKNTPESIVLQKEWENLSSKIKKKTIVPKHWKFTISIAASIIFGVLLFFNSRTSLNKSIIENTPIIVKNDAIEIGTDKAILTLEDGSENVLEKGKSFNVKNQLSSNGQKLVYNSSANNKNSSLKYNLLTIPKGGQFFIILSDGTKVWLNSESQLRYPVSFADGKSRKVELIYGEAYFDVSPSSNHKGAHFLVANSKQEIDVVGTEFNIKAYKDDSNIFTTLVEGQIIIKNKEILRKLSPGKQSRLNKETNKISINTIDISDEVSWKEGVFSFKNKPLHEIMKTLSRWYNMDVVYLNEKIKGKTFTGIFNKEQKIDHIFNIIKNINSMNFEIEGRVVYLK